MSDKPNERPIQRAIARAAGWTWCDEHNRPRWRGSSPCARLHPEPSAHTYYREGEIVTAPCQGCGEPTTNEGRDHPNDDDAIVCTRTNGLVEDCPGPWMGGKRRKTERRQQVEPTKWAMSVWDLVNVYGNHMMALGRALDSDEAATHERASNAAHAAIVSALSSRSQAEPTDKRYPATYSDLDWPTDAPLRGPNGRPLEIVVSVICRECLTLVDGEVAGNAVKWVVCPECQQAESVDVTLLPCPFCGGRPFPTPQDMIGMFAVCCASLYGCGNRGPRRRTVAEAIAAWNRRPPSPSGGDE